MGARLLRSPEEGATVLLGAHFPEPFARRFRVLAASLGMTKKALLEEAINDALAKDRKGTIPATAADVRRPD